MLEGLGAALQALDGSAPLQRRRPAATMSSTTQRLLAPETVLLRMLLKEAAGVWRPAWVEVRPDGRILVFPETLTGGVGAPTESVERHVERLVDFMPVLDDFKAVCLRFLPPTGATGAAPVCVVLASAESKAGGMGGGMGGGTGGDMCRDYLAGRCSRGANCRFDHGSGDVQQVRLQ